MKSFTFKEWDCVAKEHRYGNGQAAIVLNGAHTGERIAVASVNLEEHGVEKPRRGHTWIKTWAENEGILEALEDAGVVRATGETFEVNRWGSKAALVEILF